MPTTQINYAQHRLNWQGCTACDLHCHRKRVVLMRGYCPAPVLFIGEAPGESEDVLGRPFIGPAGHLLDNLIERAGIPEDHCAFTNLIACIPRDNEDAKLITPPKFAIDACRPRLEECVRLVKPKLIVMVGKEAEQHTPFHEGIYQVGIVHPAYILRAHVAQRGLLEQRCVIGMEEAYEEAMAK